MGEDKYPKDCESLLGMMNNFRPSREVKSQAPRLATDSALLFYGKLREELEDFGFRTNPSNPCMAN